MEWKKITKLVFMDMGEIRAKTSCLMLSVHKSYLMCAQVFEMHVVRVETYLIPFQPSLVCVKVFEKFCKF